MDLETGFSASSQLAMVGWIMLAAWPRRPRWLLALTGLLIPAALGLAYGILVLPNIAKVDGAGYSALDGVRALMSDDRLLLGGWIHYLAFDLAVGTFIAWKSDKIGLTRLVQLPLLFLTFMFGPIGLSLFAAMLGLRKWGAPGFFNHDKTEDVA